VKLVVQVVGTGASERYANQICAYTHTHTHTNKTKNKKNKKNKTKQEKKQTNKQTNKQKIKEYFTRNEIKCHVLKSEASQKSSM
jgi:hypothetical protein